MQNRSTEMSLLQTHPPLAALLKDSGAHPASLSRIAVQKASDLLRSLPESRLEGPIMAGGQEECSQNCAVLQCMETLLFLLPQIEDEDTLAVGKKVVCDLLDPYLTRLSGNSYFIAATNHLRLAAHVQALGTVLGVLLHNSAVRTSLGDEIVKVFVELFGKFCNQRSCEVPEELNRGCAVNPTTAISILDHMLQTAIPNEIESATFSLSSLFDSVMQLMLNSDLATCYRLTSSILPLFVTHLHLDRVEGVWQFVLKVRRQKLHTNSQSSDLVLTIICCFSNLFVSYNHSSPFSSLLPKFLSGRPTPVHDLRTEPVFWSIVQEGLASSDPVSRKRCMYLVQCVLASVRGEEEGGGEVGVLVAKGGVFWWSGKCSKELGSAWDSLMLIIETMEEKQVGK